MIIIKVDRLMVTMLLFIKTMFIMVMASVLMAGMFMVVVVVVVVMMMTVMMMVVVVMVVASEMKVYQTTMTRRFMLVAMRAVKRCRFYDKRKNKQQAKNIANHEQQPRTANLKRRYLYLIPGSEKLKPENFRIA